MRWEDAVGGEEEHGNSPEMGVCLAKAAAAAAAADGHNLGKGRIEQDSAMDEVVAMAAAGAEPAAEAWEVPLAARGRHYQTC